MYNLLYLSKRSIYKVNILYYFMTNKKTTDLVLVTDGIMKTLSALSKENQRKVLYRCNWRVKKLFPQNQNLKPKVKKKRK